MFEILVGYKKARVADSVTSKEIVKQTDPDAKFFRSLEDNEIFLNERQVQAVRHNVGPALILAAAGSGKTSVLTNRVCRLITVENVDPRKIMLLTFTKKAAEEMVDRLGKLPNMSKDIARKVTAGTFHSVFLSILRQNGMEKEIWSSTKSKEITIETIQRKLGLEQFKPEVILSQISSYKNRLIDVDSAPKDDKNQRDFALIWGEYELHKIKNKLIDFDDMLILTYKLFKNNPGILERIRNQYDYILIDEFQDTNYAQFELARMIANPKNNLFAVGDDFQCQPEGTQVLTNDGYVPIEKLEPNKHKLVSYDKGHSIAIGFKDGYSFKKASRKYKGRIATIRAEGKESRCTPEHKWLVKWTQKAKEKTHVVYLMKQDNRFRIGWCKLFSTKGSFHLGVRSNIEKADAAWILLATEDRTEASLWESFLATKYGIPLVPFEPLNNAAHYTKETLDRLFEMSSNFLPERAMKCLTEHGRDINYPIWTPDKAFGQRSGKSIMTIETCNLISDLHSVPVQIKGKEVKWTPLKVEFEEFDGMVYSLDVEKYNLYISDGLVTHNCIYSFNGARSDNILNFNKLYPDAKVIPLEINYRSSDYIVGLGSDIIKENTQQMKKTVYSAKPSNVKPVFVQTLSAEEEATTIADHIQDAVANNNAKYKDYAILYRNNSNARAIFDELLIRKIPFIQFGSDLIFYEDPVVKPILAYLRLALKPTDAKSMEQILPTLYLKKDLIKHISKEQMKNPISHPIEHVFTSGLKPFQENKIREKISLIKRLTNYKPIVAIKTIREEYEKYLIGDDDSEEKTLHKEIIKETLDELEASSIRFDTIEEYISFVNAVIRNSIIQKEMQKNPNSDSVKLMTIHRSKGLEFERVYIIHCSEEIIPSATALEECKDVIPDGKSYDPLEEERRLMYVGVTRAREYLTISSIQMYRGRILEPSRFVKKYVI